MSSYELSSPLHETPHPSHEPLITIPSDEYMARENINLIQAPIGLVALSQTKQFKKILIELVREVWTQANLWRPIEGDECVSQGGKSISQIQIL